MEFFAFAFVLCAFKKKYPPPPPPPQQEYPHTDWLSPFPRQKLTLLDRCTWLMSAVFEPWLLSCAALQTGYLFFLPRADAPGLVFVVDEFYNMFEPWLLSGHRRPLR